MLNSLTIEKIDSLARTVAVFRNPNSGSGKRKARVQELITQLTSAGFQVEQFDKFASLEEAVTRLWQENKLRVVVAAGGDGTINALVNLLPAEIPLTILPLGTENLVAKHLGLDCKVEQLAQAISEGQTIRLDVGKANDRLFLLMFGCGFDAEVVRRLHESRTGHITQLNYLKPLWQTIWNYRYPHFRITIDREPTNETSQITARWAFINNLPRYATQLCFTPAANASDGLLDLCAFERAGFWNGLRYLSSVILGSQAKLTDCNIATATSYKLESLGDEKIPYQLDGDPAGELPVTVQVVPQRVRMCVSQQWIEKMKNL